MAQRELAQWELISFSDFTRNFDSFRVRFRIFPKKKVFSKRFQMHQGSHLLLAVLKVAICIFPRVITETISLADVVCIMTMVAVTLQEF